MKTERQMQRKFLLKDGDYQSTKEVFERVAKIIPDRPLLADLDKNKNIVYHTAKEILSDIENIGDGLIDLGLEGKHIAISADNSYRYVICDLSVAGGVGVVTPIDRDAPEDLFTTLLNKCDADALICSAHLIEKVQKVLPNCKNLKTIITIDKKVEGFICLDEVIEKGKQLAPKQIYHNKKLKLGETVEILFTSGTTGANKGVELTQNNLSANIINCLDTIKGDNGKTNTSMSILPMHHATEINTHIMPRIAAGRLTYINDSLKNMMNNIKIFKPYVITIVPMIANAFYKTIWENAKKAGKDKKLEKGIKLTNSLRKLHIDITHKLFKEVYAPFGGNLKQIVCGGAMLNPEVVKGFNDLGVVMINGYGITECGPLVSMNADTLNEPYSVGKICPNLKAKLDNIDENGIGELCIKGKSVSKGYYKDSKSTKLVYDFKGYFHTGDLAKIDDQGRVFLTGRKKNVIILDNGKNVCPEEIENEIEIHLPYAKDVVVYPAQKQTGKITQTIICAGVFIEDENTRKDKNKILNDFREINKLLPNYKRVNFVNLPDSEYEKTSTRKIKRTTVMEKHNEKTGISV